MLEQLKEEFAIGVLECGKFRNIRDYSLENVAYAEKVKDLCNLLQDTIRSKSPQQSLLAEKYCIVFQRNYCTTNEAERAAEWRSRWQIPRTSRLSTRALEP